MSTKKLDEFCETQRVIKECETTHVKEALISNMSFLNFDDEIIVGIYGTYVTHTEFHDGIESRFVPTSHIFEYHGRHWRHAQEILDTYSQVDLEGQVEIQEWSRGEEKILLPILIVKKITGRGTKHQSTLWMMNRYNLAPWKSVQDLRELYKDIPPEEDISDHEFNPPTKQYDYQLCKRIDL